MRNYILLLITAVFFYSCSDTVDMKESDLKKYPWLISILTSEIKDFKGIHNVDVGSVEFSYTIPIESKNDLFIKIDSSANSENWSLVDSSVMSREYSKKLNQYQTDTGHTVVKIELDSIGNRIHFKIK